MQDLVRRARSPRTQLASSIVETDETHCTCCQHAKARWSVEGHLLCPTCVPAYALDAPSIDEVASLIWLPQVDQGVLSRFTLALHLARALEHHSVGPISSEASECAAATLSELRALSAGVIERIGTAQISHLREAARGLDQPPLQRAHYTCGIRVLHHGPGENGMRDTYRSYIKTLIEGSGH